MRKKNPQHPNRRSGRQNHHNPKKHFHKATMFQFSSQSVCFDIDHRLTSSLSDPSNGDARLLAMIGLCISFWKIFLNGGDSTRGKEFIGPWCDNKARKPWRRSPG